MILASATDTLGLALDGNFSGKSQGSPGDDFRWTFSFPRSNDDFTGAQVLAGASGDAAGSNRYARIETVEPRHAGPSLSSASVWYRWSAPETGWVTFDILTATFDTILSIYTGSDVGTLNVVAANDNYGSRKSARASFAATGSHLTFLQTPEGEPDQALCSPQRARF